MGRLHLDGLRMAVALPIVASHLFSFYLILGRIDATIAERVEVSLIIGPIFGVYIAAIVRKVASLMTSPWDRSPTHPLFAVMSVGAALTFAFAVPWILLQFLNHEIQTVSGLKTTLGIAETALGVYTGSFIDSLFGSQIQQGAAPVQPKLPAAPAVQNPDADGRVRQLDQLQRSPKEE